MGSLDPHVSNDPIAAQLKLGNQILAEDQHLPLFKVRFYGSCG